MSSHIVSKQNAEEKTLTNQSPSHFSPNSEVVRLQKVGVRYRLPSERIGSFKEYTIRWIQRRVTHRDFWALQDVNLSVNRGETLGLIGHNGAGKSTLLKLIARVFRPTAGRVVVMGKVAPLLEFGAGFHPELTGRENIFLNGALMGFSHREMEGKLEGIVNFAELWDFIDVPMRTYSSGMWARLGFAVATDVQPDILLIDEVLSVGDESFKRKSSARMQEFRDREATIILVSHDMEMIQSMCSRAAWLDHGQIKAIGKTSEVVQAYLQNTIV